MCHLFIQSTALFALSNITYYVFYVDKGEEQIDICLMLCFLLRINKQTHSLLGCPCGLKNCMFLRIAFFVKTPKLTNKANNEPICFLGATEELPISHLFIQSTALFALSICVLG